MTFINLIPDDVYNVKQYGALGNGVQDDTSFIANAISAAVAAGGGVVFFPAGVYLSGNQTLVSNVILCGAGVGATTLKLKNGANTDLLSAQTGSINLSASSGSGSAGTLSKFSIRDMKLDGNNANQTSGTSYPLRFYGYNFELRNLDITGGYTGGALIDWNAPDLTSPSSEMEAVIDTIKVHDNNGIGWQMGGPHDSRMNNVLSFVNGSHNFHFTPNAAGVLGANNHGYACPNTAGICSWLIEAPGCQFTNCYGEGSYYCDVAVIASNVSWVGGNVNGATGSATEVGMQLGQLAGQTPFVGQIHQSAGVTTAVQVGGCIIQTQIINCKGGALKCANEGLNIIDVNAFQPTGTALVGNVINKATDTFRINVQGATSDNTLGTSGGMNICVNHSNEAFTITDSTGGQVFLVDWLGNITIPSTGGFNTASALFFTTTTSPASLASSGTINVANLAVISVAPTSNVNGVIMQAGFPGQFSSVINASAFSIQFAASGTSNVANGTSEIIPPNSTKYYIWNGTNNLWYSTTTVGMSSASAASIASSGTITTAGLDQSRVTTSGAVTGVILQAGTYANQAVTVVNESANSITFAAVGTSNVADGVSAVIAANRMMIFRWDASTSKWYHA